MFSHDPLHFDLLRKQKIDVQSDIAALTLNDGALKDVRVRATLQNGHLEYYSWGKDPRGGRATVRVDITAPGSQADVAAQIFMRDLKLNLISGESARMMEFGKRVGPLSRNSAIDRT